MARIKINDLPKDAKLSADDLKRLKGGSSYAVGYGVAGKYLKNTLHQLGMVSQGVGYIKW